MVHSREELERWSCAHRSPHATTSTAAGGYETAPGKRSLTERLVVQRRAAADGDAASPSTPVTCAPNERARPTLQMLFGVQPVATAAAEHAAQVRAVAALGTTTPAARLPYAEQIQRAFGRHDISGIQAHTAPEAAATAGEIGARAYATGDHVVLGRGTDLHTVAHEAAHVVQQRAGAHLDDGVGRAGDPHEHHADAVADAVVQGRSAEGLLDRYPPAGGVPAAGGAIQRAGDPAMSDPERCRQELGVQIRRYPIGLVAEVARVYPNLLREGNRARILTILSVLARVPVFREFLKRTVPPSPGDMEAFARVWNRHEDAFVQRVYERMPDLFNGLPAMLGDALDFILELDRLEAGAFERVNHGQLLALLGCRRWITSKRVLDNALQLLGEDEDLEKARQRLDETGPFGFVAEFHDHAETKAKQHGNQLVKKKKQQINRNFKKRSSEAKTPKEKQDLELEKQQAIEAVRSGAIDARKHQYQEWFASVGHDPDSLTALEVTGEDLELARELIWFLQAYPDTKPLLLAKDLSKDERRRCLALSPIPLSGLVKSGVKVTTMKFYYLSTPPRRNLLKQMFQAAVQSDYISILPDELKRLESFLSSGVGILIELLRTDPPRTISTMFSMCREIEDADEPALELLRTLRPKVKSSTVLIDCLPVIKLLTAKEELLQRSVLLERLGELPNGSDRIQVREAMRSTVLRRIVNSSISPWCGAIGVLIEAGLVIIKCVDKEWESLNGRTPTNEVRCEIWSEQPTLVAKFVVHHHPNVPKQTTKGNTNASYLHVKSTRGDGLHVKFEDLNSAMQRTLWAQIPELPVPEQEQSRGGGRGRRRGH